jgi:hypothetical protein
MEASGLIILNCLNLLNKNEASGRIWCAGLNLKSGCYGMNSIIMGNTLLSVNIDLALDFPPLPPNLSLS